jgi:hypothetical protein
MSLQHVLPVSLPNILAPWVGLALKERLFGRVHTSAFRALVRSGLNFAAAVLCTGLLSVLDTVQNLTY